MTDSTIACPQCRAEIPWTKTVSPRLREQPEAEFEKLLQKAIQPTAELDGGGQGITGREALPEIRVRQLPG